MGVCGLGAGSVAFALGKIDAWLSTGEGMCLWDLCALCALARTVGGCFAHMDGEEIDFSKNGEVDVRRGFILGRNEDIL